MKKNNENLNKHYTKSTFYAMFENKGITLIALIVTIIIMLILAGVTVANITGGDSAMEKASQAKDETAVQEELEEIQSAIANASAKGIRHGNFSGSADASSIKAALTKLVTDTSGITGNGPWQVTGSKTGTKYLIKQDYEIITMPENTGTRIEMNVKTGDFVNYDAGVWTQEEIDKMGNLYSGETIPTADNPYTFGGFKAGQSKNIGIIQGENNVAEIDEEHSGWRVLKINDDGSINIIHAGCPEWFYHPRGADNSYISQYLLTGIKGGNNNSIFNNINQRICTMYENSYYTILKSSHLVTKTELGYTGPANTWERKIGISFWVGIAYPDGGGVFICRTSDGSMNNYNRNTSCGVRPVVTLKAECLFQNVNDENTSTHDTQETAWNLVI